LGPVAADLALGEVLASAIFGIRQPTRGGLFELVAVLVDGRDDALAVPTESVRKASRRQ
jgi:hypothetical protein